MAILTNDEEGQTRLELTSTKGHQGISFLSGEKICKLNFTADDLWLIGLIEKPSTSKLVKWNTDKIYPQTVLYQDVLPIPEYQELFQVNGSIGQFEFLLNMSFCVYAVDSVIYVRNLITNKVVYHVEMNPPYTFKFLSRKSLLLTSQTDKSRLEVRKVNIANSDFPNPAYGGSQYLFFTRNSRYLITRPLDKQLEECLSTEAAVTHIAYEIRPHLLNLKKCLGYLLEKRKYKHAKYFLSPLLNYAVLMNIEVFCLWNIVEEKRARLFKERLSFPWHQLRNDFFKNKNYTLFSFTWGTIVCLSDDLFLAVAYQKQIIVIDLQAPHPSQYVLNLTGLHSIRNIGLSKNDSQPKALFYNSKNTIVCCDCTIEKTKREFKGHTHKVLNFDTSFDNRLLISSGKDRTLRLWDILSGKQLDCVETLKVNQTSNSLPMIVLSLLTVNKKIRLLYGR